MPHTSVVQLWNVHKAGLCLQILLVFEAPDQEMGWKLFVLAYAGEAYVSSRNATWAQFGVRRRECRVDIPTANKPGITESPCSILFPALRPFRLSNACLMLE